jgi:putative endonuclease
MSNKTKNKADNRTKKRKTGDLGEKVVCTFLMKRGFEIVETNYLKKYGELDIIAKKDDINHFIEVKSVSCETFPNVNHETDGYKPEDNLHAWKLKRLSKTIQAYIQERKIFDKEWQFDIATVYLNTVTRTARVVLLEDIIL